MKRLKRCSVCEHFLFFQSCCVCMFLLFTCVLVFAADADRKDLVYLFLFVVSTEVTFVALPCCVCKLESGGMSDDLRSDPASLPSSLLTAVLMLPRRSSCSWALSLSALRVLISSHFPKGTHLSPFVADLPDKLSADLENKDLHASEEAVTEMKTGNNGEPDPDHYINNVGASYLSRAHTVLWKAQTHTHNHR